MPYRQINLKTANMMKQESSTCHHTSGKTRASVVAMTTKCAVWQIRFACNVAAALSAFHLLLLCNIIHML
jgi:hypothetical protein